MDERKKQTGNRNTCGVSDRKELRQTITHSFHSNLYHLWCSQGEVGDQGNIGKSGPPVSTALFTVNQRDSRNITKSKTKKKTHIVIIKIRILSIGRGT